MPEFQVEYIDREPLPNGLDAPNLRRRVLGVVGVLVLVALVALFAPGLGELRHRLRHAEGGWLAAGVALELLSCLSYVLMFRPVFCRRMTWRSAYELGMAELAGGSIVPARGARRPAFGVWALRRGGMPARDIAQGTVAFFVLKSAANFVAVAVIGVLMWVGVGPHRSPLLTLLPAVLAVLAIVVVALIPRLVAARRRSRAAETTRVRRWLRRAGEALEDGLLEAGRILRRGDWRVIVGSLGYWAFDNAVLWACLRAVGESPPITLVLMGYLIGQLGGLLPLPGGLGGIDGGLLGTLVVYGVPVGATAAAILAYRMILFWLPLFLGGVAFVSLRKGLNDP